VLVEKVSIGDKRICAEFTLYSSCKIFYQL